MDNRIRPSGFTLFEMVLTIVLLGIIAGVLAPTISQSIRAYSDTSARAELTARGRFALERLAREIRHAVPNTVQVLGGGNGVGFVTSKAGGRYMSTADSFSVAAYLTANRFVPNVQRTGLYILGTNYNDHTNTDRLVIYNLSPADYLDGISNVAIDNLYNPGDTYTGLTVPDAVQRLGFEGKMWTAGSPGQHYQIADYCHEFGLIAVSATLNTQIMPR